MIVSLGSNLMYPTGVIYVVWKLKILTVSSRAWTSPSLYCPLWLQYQAEHQTWTHVNPVLQQPCYWHDVQNQVIPHNLNPVRSTLLGKMVWTVQELWLGGRGRLHPRHPEEGLWEGILGPRLTSGHNHGRWAEWHYVSLGPQSSSIQPTWLWGHCNIIAVYFYYACYYGVFVL